MTPSPLSPTQPWTDIWGEAPYKFLGEGFPTRAPIMDTIIQMSSSGQDEVRIAKYPYPRYKYTFEYQYLGDDAQVHGWAANNDYQQFMYFYKNHAGRFYSFMLSDPDDNCIPGFVPPGPGQSYPHETIGTGDGVTTMFQCMRTKNGFQEPVYGIKNTTGNGNGDVVVSPSLGGYTVNSYGVITFNNAPGNGVSVQIYYTNYFYQRVRFDDDTLEFQKVGIGIWALKSVTMITTRQ